MEFDKLKKLFQAPLLDELYNSRCEDFETELMKAKKAGEEYIEDIGNRFDAILKTIDQKHYDFVSKEQEEIYKQLLSYAEIFGKEYYKLGIVDGFVLKHELAENKVKENNIAFNHKFFDNYDTDYRTGSRTACSSTPACRTCASWVLVQPAPSLPACSTMQQIPTPWMACR